MVLGGYPPYTILLVLGLGLPLALLRPYWAFLGVVLFVTAGHVSMLNQTRAPGLVPLLNLMHSCMLVALLACFFDRVGGRKPIWMPPIVGLMVSVIAVATVQTVWSSGWRPETMQACRGALDFPLAYFLGANMVTSEGRLRKLIHVLVAGTLLASLQHVSVAANIWRTKSLDMESYNVMRTIGFWAGCMPSAFLAAAAIWPMPRRIMTRILAVVAGLLLLASLFLNQTRSLWLATILAAGFVVALFKKRNRVKTVLVLGVSFVILFSVLGWLGQIFLPGISVFEIAADRADDLLHNDVHIGTRARSFVAEMTQWCDGTLIFGRGLSFFDAIENSEDSSRHIAFNHLGYVTYLSQLGIIGFLVYGMCLPLGVLRNGLWLWRNGESGTLCYLALIGTASIICLSILFSMSGHFLLRGYEPTGVLYGAMWALAKRSPDVRESVVQPFEEDDIGNVHALA